jgi:hypothetical protein
MLKPSFRRPIGNIFDQSFLENIIINFQNHLLFIDGSILFIDHSNCIVDYSKTKSIYSKRKLWQKSSLPRGK